MQYSTNCLPSTHAPYQAQAGFTLIELMISLVLGLLISAAVVQIYIINVKTSTVQKSGSELQDASVFGLQTLENHIRLANMGNSESQITDTTAKGGIVLTSQNFGVAAADYTTGFYLTKSAGETGAGTGSNHGWTGVSNTDQASDQLVLQFRNITNNGMPDCEGNTIDANDVVIERYFLRPSTTGTASGNLQNLVLACDAGRITVNADGTFAGPKNFGGTDQHNFGQAGQEFILGVDQFKIMLGAQVASGATTGQVNYLTPKDYKALTTAKPAIISVKVGMIVHGATPMTGSDDLTDFTVLGTANILKDKTVATRSKKFRTTYESTTLLRNARVMNIAQ